MGCYPSSALERLHKLLEEDRQVKRFNKKQMTKYLKEQRRQYKMEDQEEKKKMIATEDTMKDAKQTVKDSDKKIVTD